MFNAWIFFLGLSAVKVQSFYTRKLNEGVMKASKVVKAKEEVAQILNKKTIGRNYVDPVLQLIVMFS